LQRFTQSPPDAAKSAGQAAAPEGPLDLTFLKASFGEDAILIKEILGEYVTPAQNIVAEMQAAFAGRDAAAIGAAAHKLKSASRAVGATALADLSQNLEKAGKASDWGIIDANMQQLAGLFAEVIAHIRGTP
jgi:HPt (histidine-containing phosphotransfer) domain-containing protein